MILKQMITLNTFHKVRQLELLSKTSLFANSCKSSQLGRTSTTLANIKQCLNSNVINNGNKHSLTKLPTTATVGMQLSRKGSTVSGDHVRMWVLERIASVALPVIIPTALIMENSILDGIMSLLIVMHTHWGLEAIITDYARPIVVGPVVPKILHFSLIILSAVTLTGLFMLINDGPGVSKAIKNVWAIGKEPKRENGDIVE